MKRQFSAGGIVFKKVRGKELWLVAKPSNTETWRLPKGMLNDGEGSEEAAKREVLEETGVEAKIEAKVGSVSWWFVEKKEKVFKTVAFFLMEATKETGEFDFETEEIKWLDLKKASKILTYKSEKNMLIKAAEILHDSKQAALF